METLVCIRGFSNVSYSHVSFSRSEFVLLSTTSTNLSYLVFLVKPSAIVHFYSLCTAVSILNVQVKESDFCSVLFRWSNECIHTVHRSGVFWWKSGQTKCFVSLNCAVASIHTCIAKTHLNFQLLLLYSYLPSTRSVRPLYCKLNPCLFTALSDANFTVTILVELCMVAGTLSPQ